MAGTGEPKRGCVAALAAWQATHAPWALMSAVCVALVLLAHYGFQRWLFMPPCEQCVYIRFAFLVMALGGLVCLLNPKALVARASGYALAFAGAAYGLSCSLKLQRIHHAIHSDDPGALFGMQGCSLEPHYPLALPLEKWAPDWFLPTGDCGYDLAVVPPGATLSSAQQWLISLYNSSDSWYLIPPLKFMTMAQCCMLAFGVMLAVLSAMAGAALLSRLRGNQRS